MQTNNKQTNLYFNTLDYSEMSESTTGTGNQKSSKPQTTKSQKHQTEEKKDRSTAVQKISRLEPVRAWCATHTPLQQAKLATSFVCWSGLSRLSDAGRCGREDQMAMGATLPGPAILLVSRRPKTFPQVLDLPVRALPPLRLRPLHPQSWLPS
jgi:hypothetical protein